MENFASFNYAALTDKTLARHNFTPLQLQDAGLHFKNTWPVVMLVIGMIGVPLAVMGLMRGELVNLVEFLMFAVAAVVLTFFVRKDEQAKLRMLKFALDNHLEYRAARALPPTEPIMFNIGNMRYQNNSLSTNTAMFADYHYTVGSGKSQRTYSFNYMQIKLPRAVPHLFLNSRKNAVNPNSLAYEVQKLRLEGDFGKHFELLAPPGYQVDALQIFTPDVMGALMDHGQDYDFELIDDHLYVYQNPTTSPVSLYSEAELRKFWEAVYQIAAELGHQTRRYSDTRAGNVASGLVAHSGAKFQRRQMKVWVVAAAIAAVFLLYLALNFIL
jgi:hypothetical protein